MHMSVTYASQHNATAQIAEVVACGPQVHAQLAGQAGLRLHGQGCVNPERR